MSKIPIIVVHAGAGTVPEKLRRTARDGILKAIRIGWEALISGETAINVVEKTVIELENFHQFNAGYGSVMTEKGTVEMDALIMDGKTRKVGGVIAVSRIKNPIALSRKIMDKSAHVIFTGEGAEKFAIDEEMKLIDPQDLITDRVRERLRKFMEKEGGYGAYMKSTDPERRDKYGTVGAVAIDSDGNFASATSTGGVLGKKIGRVGDTPIVGAGTYADETMAFSATGVGEYIIRSVLGMEVKMQLRDYPNPKIASQKALEVMKKTIGGDAGLIVVTRDGWAAEKTTDDLIYAMRSADMSDYLDFSQTD